MTSKPSSVPSSSRLRVGTVVPVLGIAAAFAVALGAAFGLGEPLRWLLCVIQIAALGVVLEDARRGRGWTSAGFITAAAWGAIFTLPCLIYTADPALFDLPGLTGTIAVVTGCTCAFALAYVIGRARWPENPPAIQLEPARVARGGALAGYGFGLLALAAIVANAGGPVAYLTNLNATAGTNSGLWYVVSVMMFMRWVPAAIIAQRWSAGERAGRVVLLAYAIGTLLLTLTGARLFLVLGLLEIGVLWSLLRRPIPIRQVVAGGLILGLAIVFGLGTVKRFQSAQANGTTDQGFVEYAVSTAPREAVDAYVNNYVDTVRLMGLARALVPAQAPYEGLRPLEELVLKPLPSGIRPKIDRSPTISFVFAPAGDTAYAVPLQANALLAAGLAAAVVVSALIGLLARIVDRQLIRAERLKAWQLLVLIAAILEIPMVIRSGIPNGVATALTDVVGSAAGAWLVLRAVREPPSTTPGASA